MRNRDNWCYRILYKKTCCDVKAWQNSGYCILSCPLLLIPNTASNGLADDVYL